MKNLFNSIKLTKPKKNVFDLSHDVKLSLDMGKIVPILALDCVPGDKFTIGCESLLRFAPMIAPVMHRMDVTFHYFFVPNRIVWDGWEKWITDANSTRVFPYLEFTGGDCPTGSLPDYLGLPDPAAGEPYKASALPFAAYQMIYNEYYRDQNLVNEINFPLTDGDNDSHRGALTALRTRAWEHDYFTASLPFAQKGEAVDIPLGTIQGNAEVVKDFSVPGVETWNTEDSGDGDFINVNAENLLGTSSRNLFAKTEGLEVGSTTINDLRRAYRLQEWLERNARAGTRYVESILAHFGVRSSDKRLQRPEYITGVKSPVTISEVLNTTGTQTDISEPQGTMAGHGISVTGGKYGGYFCEEHGYIIGVMSVMPKPAYQQGIPKHFLKIADQFDFFTPSFANIGEQEVRNGELYAENVTEAFRNEVFGYVPRYAEYKYMPSRVAGDFKGTLDFWHFGRKFATAPALNQTFIECNPGKRIFAVDSTEHSLYCHVYNKIQAVRPMPKFGTPIT